MRNYLATSLRSALVSALLITSVLMSTSPAEATTHVEKHCHTVLSGTRVCESYHYQAWSRGIHATRLDLTSNHCGSIRRFIGVRVKQTSRTWDAKVLPNGGCSYSHRIRIWTRGHRARVDVGTGVTFRGVSGSRTVSWVFHVCRGGGC